MLTKLQSLRTFPKNMKYFLTAAGDKVFGKFKHTFLYYACSENHVSVGKADLHIAEKIKLSDTLQQYCDIFDKINSGFVSSIEEDTKQQNEEQNEQDEGEYEEEDGDDGDDSTKIEAIL